MRSGAVIDGRFRIERFAGSGGMGEVYKAEDLDRGVPVALKIARPGIAAEHAARIVREARALSGQLGALVHPGIVGYVAHGMAAGRRPYLVMEWLDGCDLDQRLRQGRLDDTEVIQLGLQICSALGAAHGCGVVHRDLKPANIFLASGDLTQARLIDFGLARLEASTTVLTRTGMLLGTPGFMAPEQARGERGVDARADLYSLGAVLFACSTGRPPFVGEHYLGVLARLALEEAPRISELRPEVSPALDALVARLLAKQADARPASADEVAAALAAIDPGTLGRGRDATAGRRRAISQREQRFLSVLLIARAAPPRDRGVSPALIALIARQEGAMAHLHDGTTVAMFMAEDDPATAASRAARCALAAREAGLRVPMAVATGRGQTMGQAADHGTARGPSGSVFDRAVGLHLDLISVGGETLDLSLPSAPVHDIALDHVTAGLIAHRFQVRRADSGAYVLAGESAHPRPVRGSGGRTTELVGRERELASLLALVEECVDQPCARALLVTGPAGAGKSRLARELMDRLAVSGQALAIWTARGDAMRAGSSLGLLAQIIAQAMGWEPAASLAERQACLVRRVSALLPEDSAARVIPFLGEIAGVPFPDQERVQLREARRDPRLMHDQMRQAWEDWLEAEVRARPVLLVLDDLHWGDLPTVRFVDGTLRHLADWPLCVLALARPRVRQLFPDLWAGPGLEHMPLRPLARRACLALARQVGPAGLDDHALERLVARSGGNPFFMEELLRHAAGGHDGEPPETVLAMVGARLHALPADERRVLRAASVFGRSFWTGGVAALLDEPDLVVASLLERLVARDLVRPERRSRLAEQAEHAFPHELTRDAAHAMLTDEDRVLAHRRAGEWLEQAGERDAIVLAEHYWRGQGPLQALPWFRRAAEQALEASDVQAAIERAERAIACGARDDVLGALRLVQAEAHNWRAEHERAHACAREAMQHLPRTGETWAHAAHQVVWAACMLGRADEVAALAEEVRENAAEAPGEVWIATLARCAVHLVLLCRDADAHAIARWIEARPRPDTHSLAATISHMRAVLAAHTARLDEAAEMYAQALVHWRAVGNVLQVVLDGANLGLTLRELGQYEQSIEVLRESLEPIRRVGGAQGLQHVSMELAIALARHGALAEARHIAEHAVVSNWEPRQIIFAHLYQAQIALLDGRAAAALEEVARALAGTSGDAFVRVHPFALAVKAQALLALDRGHEALEAARAGMHILDSAGGIEEGEALLRLVHAQALDAVGARDQARAAIEAAEASLHSRAARIRNPAWRESFLQRVAEHRRTLALARAWRS